MKEKVGLIAGKRLDAPLLKKIKTKLAQEVIDK
jgi:hypothetical protein